MKNRNLDKGVKITDKNNIQMYVYGGKGQFILKSLKSDTGYEYKISPMSKRHPMYDEYTYYVSLVTDYDNIFIGVLKTETNNFILSKKCVKTYSSPEVKGIYWLLDEFEREGDTFNENMEFYHMGVCSCCSRALTTPQSVEMGIGPVCFERYGNLRLKKLMYLKKKIEKKMKKEAKNK